MPRGSAPLRQLGTAALAAAGLAAIVIGVRLTAAPQPDADPPPRPAGSGVTAIRDVRVFDGERVIPRATVVVRGATIAAVGPDAPMPAGAEIVDGTGKTLLPGLIDAHTHMVGDALARALVFGVTTELDMFTSPELARAMRAEQAQGPVTGRADLRSAGVLVTVPGGHGTEYFPIPTLGHDDDPQAFVDARIAEGSDYIKIIYDDGAAYGLHFPTLTRARLAAVIAAAHARDRLAIVHVGSRAEARDAIAAGADGLAHLFDDAPPEPGFGRFVAAHNAFVVPTLTVLESVGGAASGASLAVDPRLAPYLRGGELSNLRAHFPHGGSAHPLANADAAVRQLAEAGVPILAGTDAPNPGTAHGVSLHRELELLVAAGLTPVAALAAATSVPARVFGLTDRGRVAPGRAADLLLVDGDPTADITRTRAIAAVWKDGVRVERRRADTAAQAIPRPLAGRTSGVVSRFDEDPPAAAFGAGWEVSTDRMLGGESTATMRVEDGALVVRGTLSAASAISWAGAMLYPGPRPMQPADLSPARGLRFRVMGDGSPFTLMVFARSRGRVPASTTITAGREWTTVEVPFAALDGVDGRDVTGILFSAARPGPFELRLDDVELR